MNIPDKPAIDSLGGKKKFNVSAKIPKASEATHTPGGGKVTIIDRPVKYNVEAKIPKANEVKHVPGGGNVTIIHAPVTFKNASPRIPTAADALTHKPSGGDKKIFSEPIQKIKASPRVPSAVVSYTPEKSKVKIYDQKVTYNASPRVPTAAEGLNYTAGGGKVLINNSPPVKYDNVQARIVNK